MKIRTILYADKEETEWTEWKPGPVPKGAFPLSKQKGSVYSLGRSYRWRVGKFMIGATRFRVLVVLRPDLEKCTGWLGEERDGDMTALLRYEYHGTHPGWHAHTACGKEDLVTPGRLNQLNRRFPKRSSKHNRMLFGATEESTVDIISKAFGLYRTPDGMFRP